MFHFFINFLVVSKYYFSVSLCLLIINSVSHLSVNAIIM